MKTVFSKIDDVISLWATQSQKEARTSRSRISFDGPHLYCFMRRIARLYTNARGEHMVLIAATTAADRGNAEIGDSKSRARQKIDRYATVIDIDARNHFDNLNEYRFQQIDNYEKMNRRRAQHTVNTHVFIEHMIVDEHNRYAEFFDLPDRLVAKWPVGYDLFGETIRTRMECLCYPVAVRCQYSNAVAKDLLKKATASNPLLPIIPFKDWIMLPSVDDLHFLMKKIPHHVVDILYLKSPERNEGIDECLVGKFMNRIDQGASCESEISFNHGVLRFGTFKVAGLLHDHVGNPFVVVTTHTDHSHVAAMVTAHATALNIPLYYKQQYELCDILNVREELVRYIDCEDDGSYRYQSLDRVVMEKIDQFVAKAYAHGLPLSFDELDLSLMRNYSRTALRRMVLGRFWSIGGFQVAVCVATQENYIDVDRELNDMGMTMMRRYHAGWILLRDIAAATFVIMTGHTTTQMVELTPW